jgi:tetratricopeptide (TPR) repeat protein
MPGAWLLVAMAVAAPDSSELRDAWRSARSADCAPALALEDLMDAPAGRHRERAAEAQVRCAAATLQPPDPAKFFDQPLASAALVAPLLRRELTTSIALSTRDPVSRLSTSRTTLSAIQALLADAQAADPTNWMLWDNALLASAQLADGARIQADAAILLASWSGQPAGASVVARYCSFSDSDGALLSLDRTAGAGILTACRDAFRAAHAAAPDDQAITSGYLRILESAASSSAAALRRTALVDLRRLAPDSALVGLLEAAALEESGDIDAAIARYREVVAIAPETLEARLSLGLLLAEQALTRLDAQPPEAGGRDLARRASAHLEQAFELGELRHSEQRVAARLLIQLYDRLEDQEAEDRWRSTYSGLMGH